MYKSNESLTKTRRHHTSDNGGF